MGLRLREPLQRRRGLRPLPAREDRPPVRRRSRSRRSAASATGCAKDGGRVSRLPIRVRLTLAFALAMAVVLAAPALFVYAAPASRPRRRAIDRRPESRAPTSRRSCAARLEPAVAGPARRARRELRPGPAARTGGWSTRTGAPRARADAPPSARGAARERRSRRAPTCRDGRAGAHAGAPGRPRASRVVVVGASLDGPRRRARAASRGRSPSAARSRVCSPRCVGYVLATAGLRPVEAMRRRARRDLAQRRPASASRCPRRATRSAGWGRRSTRCSTGCERSFERERRFVADASHELRTPLAVVKTELEVALRAGAHGGSCARRCVAAVEESDRLAQLAEDLLVIARADRRPAARAARAARRARAARGRARSASPTGPREQGRAITVDAPRTCASTATALRMRQALGNLVDNAIRHGAGDIALERGRARTGWRST